MSALLSELDAFGRVRQQTRGAVVCACLTSRLAPTREEASVLGGSAVAWARPNQELTRGKAEKQSWQVKALIEALAEFDRELAVLKQSVASMRDGPRKRKLIE